MAAGDRAFWSDVALAVAPPVCRLVAQATQTLPNGTSATLTYGAGSEEIDTHGFHDTTVNPTRITPTVSGLYVVSMTFAVAASATLAWLATHASKNGAAVQPYVRNKPGGNNTVCCVSATCVVSMNGTTDYLEHIGAQSAGATSTQAGGGIHSVFEVRRIGPP